VCMEIEERPRPIRSVRHGSKEVGVLLGEHIALLDGPDVLPRERDESWLGVRVAFEAEGDGSCDAA
jgi:hypothetical protein